MRRYSRKRPESGGGRHAAGDAGGPEDREIRVAGYNRMFVVWWQRRILIENQEHWPGPVEITAAACERAEYSHREKGGYAELLLSLRLQAGNRRTLVGTIEIPFPLAQEEALQALVIRVNADASERENASRPPGDFVARTPALPPQAVAPPPVRHERDRPPQPARPEPPAENPLASTVVALAEARAAAVADPAPRPEPPAPEPRVRDEPPRLRRLAYLQAPDDDEWITFRPLRTADDVRAPIPVREHG